MILKSNEAMMTDLDSTPTGMCPLGWNPAENRWCQLPEGHTGPCVFSQKRRSLPVIPATGHPITQDEIDAATGG